MQGESFNPCAISPGSQNKLINRSQAAFNEQLLLPCKQIKIPTKAGTMLDKIKINTLRDQHCADRTYFGLDGDPREELCGIQNPE